MKTRRQEALADIAGRCEDEKPQMNTEPEQSIAISLTKHRDNNTDKEPKLQDTAQFNSTHRSSSDSLNDPGKQPCLPDEMQEESPIYRIGKCQSGADKESLITISCGESEDINNNIRDTNGSDISCKEMSTPGSRTESDSQNQQHYTQLEKSHVNTPTSFGGLFPHIESQQLSVPAGESDIDVYRQSYLQDRYSQQQYSDRCKQQQQQQFVSHEQQHQQMALNSSSQVSGYSHYSQYGHTVDDEHIAAEQLASELCSTYGGSNSHMISDILKRNVGQNYVHGGFERTNVIDAMQNFDSIASNQHESLHDVDLLNTPQQLPPVDDVCQDVYVGQRAQFGDPRASSTPDVTYQRRRDGESVQNFQGSVTYNDIQLHGGRWSSQKSPIFEQNAESESPFPYARGDLPAASQKRVMNYQTERGVYCNRTLDQQHEMSPGNNDRHFLDISQINLSNRRTPVLGGQNKNIPEAEEFGGFKSPGSHSSAYGQPQHEITKMTFTPREMMETHLSQNYRYSKKPSYTQQISEYSSIYPSKEFIEQATGQNRAKRLSLNEQKENPQPKKRSRVSKYSTDEVPKVPPQMPIIDTMFQKYAPLVSRDEIHGGRHKYFVVNPSDVTQMPPKSLVTKYIDFLILENEQITEISKSTNPPVDIYVTEDMYFMDSLKVKIPFPSKKFMEWVANFYPKLNLFEMKFKGRHPQLPQDGQALRPDNRPTQEILEDTFYFFQREAMNIENRRV